METKTDVRMYTVISLNKSKSIMRSIQLSNDDLGKYFSKELLNQFSHISAFPSIYSEKLVEIGIISIEKMSIGLTEQIVIKLNPWNFTKRFSKGTFRVFTKDVDHYPDPIQDDNDNTELPIEMVVESSTINSAENELRSETADGDETTNKKKTEYKSLPVGKTGPTPIGSLKNNYSLIFRSNNYSIGFQLKNVA
jgi:hypothetical protein